MMKISKLFAVLLLFIAGCTSAASSNFLMPASGVSRINCIAVLPLKNNTQNPNAGNIVSDILSIDLIKRGGFNVMDRMEVERVLRERNIYTPDGVSPENAYGIGIILGVQAVFAGEVTQYFYKPSSLATEGAIPIVSFNLSLIDTATGRSIWTGKGTFTPSGLLASGTTPLTTVVQNGVSGLINAFFRGIGPKAKTRSRVCWYNPNTIFAKVIVAKPRRLYPPHRPKTVPRKIAVVRRPAQRPHVVVPRAKVSVLNASGNPRASMLIGVTLIKKKINVVNVSTQKAVRSRTVIYYKPNYYKQALGIARLLKKTPQLVQSGAYKWDITLIIGRDLS